jgi:hypothetical protein
MGGLCVQNTRYEIAPETPILLYAPLCLLRLSFSVRYELLLQPGDSISTAFGSPVTIIDQAKFIYWTTRADGLLHAVFCRLAVAF